MPDSTQQPEKVTHALSTIYEIAESLKWLYNSADLGPHGMIIKTLGERLQEETEKIDTST